MSFYWCVDEIQDLQNLMRQESHVESQFVSHQQWSDIAEDDNILKVRESHFVALNRTFLNQSKTSSLKCKKDEFVRLQLVGTA